MTIQLTVFPSHTLHCYRRIPCHPDRCLSIHVLQQSSLPGRHRRNKHLGHNDTLVQERWRNEDRKPSGLYTFLRHLLPEMKDWLYRMLMHLLMDEIVLATAQKIRLTQNPSNLVTESKTKRIAKLVVKH